MQHVAVVLRHVPGPRHNKQQTEAMHALDHQLKSKIATKTLAQVWRCCVSFQIKYFPELMSLIHVVLSLVTLVDCVWNIWGHWGSCSATCGGGIQQRTRTEGQQAMNGGATCQGLSNESQSCNSQACCKDTNGRLCIFPFKWRPTIFASWRTYHECTGDGAVNNNQEPWCAYKVNNNNEEQGWGRCVRDGTCPGA